MNRLSSQILLALFSLTLFLTTSSYLRADTYVLAAAFDSNGYTLYGMDDYGDLVLRNNGCGCSSDASYCYFLFVAGKLVSFGPAIPSLNYDDGTPCGVGFADSTEVCNNGRVSMMRSATCTSLPIRRRFKFYPVNPVGRRLSLFPA